MTQGPPPEEISTAPSILQAPAQLPARLARQLHLLLQRGMAALRQWAMPSNNPFLQRALRTESRRHKPFLTLLGVAIFAFALNGAAWWLWLLFVDNNRRLGGRFGNFTDPMRLPDALGGNPIGLMALLTATASAFGVLWASRARSAYLLRQELLKSTLDGLHQMPIAEERWLWMMTAHPTALSMLIGLMGLPVYVMVWWMGQWSLLDIFGLFLLFAMLGHAAPVWKPMLWQQQSIRKSGRGFDWKQWQQTLKQAQREAKDAGADESVDPLERQRRIQRALSGAASDNSVYNTEVASVQPSEKTNRQAKDAANTAGVVWVATGNSNTGGGTLFGIVAGAMIMSIGPLLRLSGGRVAPLLQQLSNSLPGEVTGLFPGFVVTWPLILARLLFSPVPFFSFVLPPVVLVVPIWLGVSHQNFTSLAANVSPVETFWTQPRQHRRKVIGAALWLAALFLLSGYGWPLIIATGELSSLLRGAPRTPDWAVATAWTIAIVLGTLMTHSAVVSYFKRAGNGGITQREAWRGATKAIAMRIGSAIGLYFIFCWLGGGPGINPAWTQRVLPTLAIAGAFILADFGSAALGATLPRFARTAWNFLRFIWFYGLAIVALFILVMLQSRIWSLPISVEVAAPVLFSPLVTLFSLFRAQLAVPAQIWPCIAAQAVLGALLLAIAAHTVFSAQRAASNNAAPVTSGWATHLLEFLATPFRTIAGVLRAVAKAMLNAFSRLEQFFQKWNDVILKWGMGYDNSIMTSELRRRLRREFWPVQWIIVLLAASSGFYYSLYSLVGWAEQRVFFVLGIAWLCSCLTVTTLGQTFDRERLNGTMVFLFLTPMTDAAILIGKLVPSLLYTAGLLMSALPLLMISCAMAFVAGSAFTIIMGLCGALTVTSTWLFAACLQLLFAVRAVKPTEGSAKAMLGLVFVEFGGWMLLFISNAFGAAGVASGLALLTLLHLGLAYICWRLALWSLRRQRYGDVTAGGKMAS